MNALSFYVENIFFTPIQQVYFQKVVSELVYSKWKKKSKPLLGALQSMASPCKKDLDNHNQNWNQWGFETEESVTTEEQNEGMILGRRIVLHLNCSGGYTTLDVS